MAQLRWAFIAPAAKRRSLANPLGGTNFLHRIQWLGEWRARPGDGCCFSVASRASSGAANGAGQSRRAVAPRARRTIGMRWTQLVPSAPLLN
jgi:hypothetical protein